ncbi:hypothetical protein KOR42_27480 [Thalassoglobus neptunius]|uniref:Uncharacterized protein n=1 Tax=Thalassoglobus neptunius TaxID=1938619 RepID=A0A5C5WZU7_9PLAN|nr:hypothetical protein [Thalassoglobus neptunius]TWT55621.1 hypothetical protein KOR42_27480 [Thalassoglobus neptunius]
MNWNEFEEALEHERNHLHDGRLRLQRRSRKWLNSTRQQLRKMRFAHFFNTTRIGFDDEFELFRGFNQAIHFRK